MSTQTNWAEVECPVGHPKRRKEGIPLLKQKFEAAVARAFAEKKRCEVIRACGDTQRLTAMPVNDFLDLITL